MKKLILAIMPIIIAGCGLTRIETTYPGASASVSYSPGYYSTSVTVRNKPLATTTTRVTAISEDISLALDLQAVGAAFAQASTVQEFESLLNSSSYMLSNLDLNGDGYVDYLRVMETVQGYNHVFVIQAVLGANVYQDVATVTAELSATPCVQIIGSPYIYGPSYYVQPVYVATPLIYAHLRRISYTPWLSPWYWNHFPSYYRHPAPIYMGHYQAYINTFMRNHRYCHVVSYPAVCHYPAYASLSVSICRNDYGRQHPEHSFTVRNADVARRDAASERVSNARDIRDIRDAEASVTDYQQSRSSLSSRTKSSDAAPASTSSRPTPISSSSASTGRSTATTKSSASAASSGSSRPASSTSSTSSTRPASTVKSSTSSRSASSVSSSSSSRPASSSTSSTVTSRVRSSGAQTTKSSGSASSGSSRPAASSGRSASTSGSTTRSSVGSSSGSTSSRPAASGSGASGSQRPTSRR